MSIFVKFQSEFDFFLKKSKQESLFEVSLNRRASVKDIIESLGVPHTEVGKLTFNGNVVDFTFIPLSKGNLDVYAIKSPFSVISSTLLRPDPFNTIKFIADVNVIKLGRLLLLSGFDVDFSSSYLDHEIADIALKEQRIVLTRDTGLLKRKKIIFAKRIKANLPYDQFVETIQFFGLKKRMILFSRCTACNIQLVKVEKKDILHILEPKTKQYFHTFFQCPQCQNVFWRGSHYNNMNKKFSSLGL